MPTIKLIGQFRFFFSSCDGSEPPHVHVEHDGKVGKFWLDPVELSKAGHLSEHQLRQIKRLLLRHRVEFMKAWYDFFDR